MAGRIGHLAIRGVAFAAQAGNQRRTIGEDNNDENFAAYCACVVMALIAAGGAAQAQSDFPNRPIHFIVGFAAGGGNDIFARLVVKKFAAKHRLRPS